MAVEFGSREAVDILLADTLQLGPLCECGARLRGRETCSECEGTGYVNDDWGVPTLSGDEEDEIEFCVTCDGEGFVYVCDNDDCEIETTLAEYRGKKEMATRLLTPPPAGKPRGKFDAWDARLSTWAVLA